MVPEDNVSKQVSMKENVAAGGNSAPAEAQQGGSAPAGKAFLRISGWLIAFGALAALLFGVGLGIALGSVFSGNHLATSPVPAPTMRPVTPTTVPATHTPRPTATATQVHVAAATTAAPSPTPLATPTPVPATPTATAKPLAGVPRACFVVLGEGDSFYGAVQRFELGGNLLAFRNSYHYPMVVYGYALDAQKEPLQWGGLSHLRVPSAKDDDKWSALEKKLAVLPIGTGILIPGVNETTCVGKGGEWKPLKGAPDWVTKLSGRSLTPEPTATATGG